MQQRSFSFAIAVLLALVASATCATPTPTPPMTTARPTPTPTVITTKPPGCGSGQRSSTREYPYCECNSGYMAYCTAPFCTYCETALLSNCFKSPAQAREPWFQTSIDTVSINLPVVAGRGSYKFGMTSLEGVYRQLEPTTGNSYDGGYTTNCKDIYSIRIPLNGPGWTNQTSGAFTIFNSTLSVTTTDTATSFNRELVFNYPLSVTLLNQVTISSALRVQSVDPGNGAIAANFKAGIVSQSYSRATGLYTVVYQTITSYPAVVKSLTIAGVTNTIINSDPTFVSSWSTIAFNSSAQQYTQRFTNTFSLPKGCYFTGDYNFDITVGCDASYTGACEPQTGVFSDRVVSESICNFGAFSPSVSFSISSYGDSNYAVRKDNFESNEKAYFFAYVASTSRTITSVIPRDIYIVASNRNVNTSTVVTFRSGGVDTNVKPAAAFNAYLQYGTTFKIEFIPSGAVSLNGETTMVLYVVVDVTYASGRRESMLLEATSSDSTTGSTTITVTDPTAAKSSASTFAVLTPLALAVAAAVAL